MENGPVDYNLGLRDEKHFMWGLRKYSIVICLIMSRFGTQVVVAKKTTRELGTYSLITEDLGLTV